VGGLSSNGVTFTVTGGAFNPTKLVVTSVNSGNNPTAGAGFLVVVQAQDAAGVPRNVAVSTGISLSLKTGTGILGGTLSGTIAAGTNEVTITGVTYTKAESGVVVTATRTSGDTLTAGDSASFTVNAGTATTLVFTTQPGSVTAGSAITGPPTVTVQDTFGNTITSSTASITVAIGNNPGGGSLSGTTTKNASSGMAAFNDLSINQGGSGYTLTASSSGLTGATSSAFDVTGAIVITSPLSGVVIQDYGVLVQGEVNVLVGADVGVMVNEYVALVDTNAGEFSALVPVDQTVTGITAELKDSAGITLGSHTIPVTVQPPTGQPVLFFQPLPAIGIAPITASFTLTSLKPIVNIALDANGDGTTDFNLTSLEGQTFIYDTPGFYFPKVTVTDDIGGVHIAQTMLQVLEPNDLDLLLQSKWEAMKDALRQSNISLALTNIVAKRRATYESMFNALTIPLASIDQVLTSIILVDQRGIEAEYKMTVTEGGSDYSYLVLFAIDEDGVWRIKFF
jgi:hypothetical protein